MLDEVHLGIAGRVEVILVPEVVVGCDRRDIVRSALQGLEQHQVLGDVFVDQVEREQRMPQMIKHPHEDHEVEAFAQGPDVIDRKLAELDAGAQSLGREPRLSQVIRIGVDPEHPFGTAPFHLDRVETAIAADVEHAHSGETLGQHVGEAAKLDAGIVAQEVIRRRPDAAEIHVVEPGPEGFGPRPDRGGLVVNRHGNVRVRGRQPSRSARSTRRPAPEA